MKPVWEGAPSKPGQQAPDRCDDVVIGAGITGLTTALLLARAGRDVCVLEAHQPGHGTTGRSTGKLSLLQGTKLSEILQRHGAEVATSYLSANRGAQQWLRDFCGERGVPLQNRVAVTYAGSPDDVHTSRAEYEAARQLDLDVTWSESPDLPVPAWGAVMLAEQAQVDPLELALALAEAVREAGGRVVHGARVRGVSWDKDPKVRIDDGRVVRADTVTVATGAPILDRGLQFSQLSAMRSYAIAFRHDLPMSHMMLSVGQDSRSLRDAFDSSGRRLLLVGGAGHETGRTRHESEHLDRLRAWTSEHFPEAREVAAWSAQDQRSTTALPLVGRLPGTRGAIRVATGFDKWGLTNGPAAAAAIAADITGTSELGSPGAYLDSGDSPLRWTWTNLSTGARLARDVVGVAAAARPRSPQTPRVTPKEAIRGCGVCPHMGGILQWNDAERSWDCPLHGSRFAPDGAVLDGPATRPAKVATIHQPIDEEGAHMHHDNEAEHETDESTQNAPDEDRGTGNEGESEGTVSESAANPTPPGEDATTAPETQDTPQTPPKEYT